MSRHILSVGIANYGLQRKFESDPVYSQPLRDGIIIISRDTRHSFVIDGNQYLAKAACLCSSSSLQMLIQLKRDNKLILFTTISLITYSLNLIP